MHADIRQLIALRDGEPTDAAVAEHVQGCSACRVELAQYRQLKTALRELPDVPSPADAWLVISERRQLECVSRQPRRSHVRRASIAASLLAALAVGIFLNAPRKPERGAVPLVGGNVADLQQRSRELEYLLQRYDTPIVMSLQTAGAISELEDGIALIDYQLNAELNGGGSEQREHELWQQRVELMETLVTVRAAETWIDSI